jgi:hypothetical protein
VQVKTQVAGLTVGSKTTTFDYYKFFQFGTKKKIIRKRDNSRWIELQGEIWIVESYVQIIGGACIGERQITAIGSERDGPIVVGSR